MPEPEAITTARLILEPLRVEHADELAGVLDDPALHEFIGGSPLPLPELQARYARLVAGAPDPAVGWLNWAIRLQAEERPVGTAQATIRGDADPPTAEVAWVVASACQGQGIATEAAIAVVRWLELQGVGTVLAHIHPEHRASARVAEAAGLEPTDVVHDGETRWLRDFTAVSDGPAGLLGKLRRRGPGSGNSTDG